jgi:hypothetical protein
MKRQLLSLIGIFLILSSIIVCFIPQPTDAATNWYNASWLYRKSITVNGTSTGVQTNYQIPFYVYYGDGTNSLYFSAEPTSGTNTADASTNATQIVDAALTSAVNDYYNGRTFYNVTRGIQSTITDYDGATKTAICTSVASQASGDIYYIQQQYARIYLNSKSQTDFDDLRFTKDDGLTLLDYWIESYTASSYALIWVEFDYIPSSPSQQTFYIYYGNTTVSNVSSGANTFIKLEDFEWSTNGTAISTDGGSVDWTVSAGGTSSVTISTTQAYGGTRSGRWYRDGTNNPDAYFAQTAGNHYAIRYMVQKDDTSYLATLHGNSTYSILYAATNAEDIVYYGPALIDTTFNATILTWQQYEVTDFSWGSSADYWFLNQKIINNGLLVTSGYADKIDFRNAIGTSELFIDNIIVRNYTNPEPIIAVWGTEEYFAVGSYLTIQDIKIFEGFKSTGDWLITVRYLNLYPPYFDTYDIKKLFVFQLLNSANTVVAQTPLTSWGNRPGSVYLSATQASSLEWQPAAPYSIRIYGTFTGNPYVHYTIQTEDWLSDDLSQLDSWVISSAKVIESYYSSTSLSLTTDIAQRGTVLNTTGGTMFVLGIPGLNTVRPLIFQTYTLTGQNTGLSADTSYITSLKDYSSSWGVDGTVMLNRIGTVFGIDAGVIGSMFFLIPMLALMLWAFMPSSSHAASILSVPIFLASVYFGTDPLFIVIVGVMMAFIFIKQWWIDK